MNALLLILCVLGITVQQTAKKSFEQKINTGTFTFTALSTIFALVVF